MKHTLLSASFRQAKIAQEHLSLAVRHYNHPDRIHRHIYSAIQELRNCTFSLQSYKHVLPGFDSWYEQWQEWMKSRPELRWSRDARNIATKQGAIRLESVANIIIAVSYDPIENFNFSRTVDPSSSTQLIAEQIRLEYLTLCSGPRQGTVEAERVYFSPDFANQEILGLLAFVCQALTALLLDARDRLELGNASQPLIDTISQVDQLNPSDFIVPKTDRTITLEISSGKIVALDISVIPQDPRWDLANQEHYRDVDFPTVGHATSAHELASAYLQTARKVFLKDGRHIPIAIFLKEWRPVQVHSLDFPTNDVKFLVWDSVARAVEVSQADAIVIICENWSAPFDEMDPMLRAEDSIARAEHLGVEVAFADGQRAYATCRIGRVAGTPILGPTEVFSNKISNFLIPIERAWRHRSS